MADQFTHAAYVSGGYKADVTTGVTIKAQVYGSRSADDDRRLYDSGAASVVTLSNPFLPAAGGGTPLDSTAYAGRMYTELKNHLTGSLSHRGYPELDAGDIVALVDEDRNRAGAGAGKYPHPFQRRHARHNEGEAVILMDVKTDWAPTDFFNLADYNRDPAIWRWPAPSPDWRLPHSVPSLSARFWSRTIAAGSRRLTTGCPVSTRRKIRRSIRISPFGSTRTN